jgi:nitrite reductase/ring-hydroxylating ferredoxin subunit
MEDLSPQPSIESFEKLVERAEELTRTFEQHPNLAVREDAMELLQAIDSIHRDAILRLVALIIESGNHELIHRATEDLQVSTLLQLYEVVPLPELVQWQELLDSVRGPLKAANADIELLQVIDGMPQLRLKGPFTAGEPELRQVVQDAIAASFGSNQSVKWEPREKPPALARLVTIKSLPLAKKQRWVELLREEELKVNTIRKLAINGMEIIICRLRSGFHAFPNACPGSALPLQMGRITGETLHCPWHACAFDLATGKRVAGSGLDLKPLTLRLQDGLVEMGVWE